MTHQTAVDRRVPQISIPDTSNSQASAVASRDIFYSQRMALKRMDNVGIVVNDLGETTDFFRDLGLELEGRVDHCEL